MPEPRLPFSARPWSRPDRLPPRRRRVEVPDESPDTDAIFLVLRRMRLPLILIVAVFTVSVIGLSLMPGVDDQGRPYHMTIFDSFYFISYMATTIGFGETPYSFTIPQRMWTTGSIYATVLGWAYALTALFGLLQEPGFRQAVALQRFARRIRHLREPFLIIGGYGQTGEAVARGLDDAGYRFVVVDKDRRRVDGLAADGLAAEVPALDADISVPSVLSLAGLGHRHCVGVLALTNDDDANLSMVMTTKLLRPEVPVVARCGDRVVEEHMRDFAADAVVNPHDRYGGYLVLSVQRPHTHRLVTWLMSPTGTPMPPEHDRAPGGRWMVCGTGEFADEVTRDLRSGGVEVTQVDPARGAPDVRGVNGFVAGTPTDTLNLALAEQARLQNRDVYLAVRQHQPSTGLLAEALGIDSVFVATDVVARESLARIITPLFRTFIDEAVTQGDAWAAALSDRIADRCGTTTPEHHAVVIDQQTAPAVARWLEHSDLMLGDLLRDPDDRDTPLSLVPLMIARRGELILAPADDEPLRVGDHVLLVGSSRAFFDVGETRHYDFAVCYVATGQRIPQTWIGRRIRRLSRPGRR